MKKILLFLALCASFTMMAQETEVVKGILPSGLTSSVVDNNATFKFYSNSAAESAQLIFYDAASGEQVGTYDLTGVVEGNNEFVIPCSELPGLNGQDLNWAVKLVGKPITEFTLINNLDDFDYTYSFNTVDNNPESDFFGRIYVGHRPNTADANNGLWIYNPDYTKVNETVINARNDGKTFRSNFRIGIDPEGKVYMPDWGDGPSGVYIFNPAEPDAGFKAFFANPDGTFLDRNSDGLITNADGEAVGGSSPGVGICGTGSNTKLYVFNEDIVVSGNGNNVSLYNIGNEDGTLAATWNKAPDATYAVGALELNTNGNVVGDAEHGGVWVAQNRAKNQNTTGVPSLIYVNAAGEVVYNSGNQSDILNGSNGGGFAISPDGKQLAISDGDTNISFYDITWTEGVPSLSYVTQFTPDITNIARLNQGVRLIYQMNFDYAGNLILSGAKVGIYSIPTEENVTIVPAKKALLVQHVDAAPTHTYTVAGSPAGFFGTVWTPTIEANDMTLNAETGKYEWTSPEATLNAGDNVEFKVTEDHSWDVSYGLNGGVDNVVLTAEKAGKYTLTVYFDPQNNNNVTGELTLIEEIVPEYSEFYVVGEFNDWNQNADGGRIALQEKEAGVYEATLTLEAGQAGEFKIITFNEDGTTKWFGGADENNLGFFLINSDMLGIDITLTNGS
ncbi:MAG: hypothetical protein SPL28_08705, partial [Bacteroidales bacterium]|nr:hypothetical protein [Bacteroidales bacterium]